MAVQIRASVSRLRGIGAGADYRADRRGLCGVLERLRRSGRAGAGDARMRGAGEGVSTSERDSRGVSGGARSADARIGELRRMRRRGLDDSRRRFEALRTLRGAAWYGGEGRKGVRMGRDNRGGPGENALSRLFATFTGKHNGWYGTLACSLEFRFSRRIVRKLLKRDSLQLTGRGWPGLRGGVSLRRSSAWETVVGAWKWEAPRDSWAAWRCGLHACARVVA